MKRNDAISAACSMFEKTLKMAPAVPTKGTGLRVLKSAGTNKKLGAGGDDITRGAFRGMALYSLALEERATCPRTCANWATCYGNNMPFATRYQSGPELLTAIAADLEHLSNSKKTAANGGRFAVRLHVLGDFYSLGYVAFWARMMEKFPGLHVFGYSHRTGAIGAALDTLAVRHADDGRWIISDSDGAHGSQVRPRADVFESAATVRAGFVTCPVQTGRRASCLDCGLCMAAVRAPVAFLKH